MSRRNAGSHVRFGSLADIRGAIVMSALPPKATAKADMVCITPRRATKGVDVAAGAAPLLV
jgi:hypothetical protein